MRLFGAIRRRATIRRQCVKWDYYYPVLSCSTPLRSVHFSSNNAAPPSMDQVREEEEAH